MGFSGFDLLGHPIPDGRGEPGRTGHIPTPEIASKIRTLLVSGLNLERIAPEVGISVPTLRKHYFASGRIKAKQARAMALAEARAKNLLQLQMAADTGNVSAMKAIEKILDRETARLLDDEVTRPEREPAPGKKQIARNAARAAEDELALFLQGEQRPN